MHEGGGSLDSLLVRYWRKPFWSHDSEGTELSPQPLAQRRTLRCGSPGSRRWGSGGVTALLVAGCQGNPLSGPGSVHLSHTVMR